MGVICTNLANYGAPPCMDNTELIGGVCYPGNMMKHARPLALMFSRDVKYPLVMTNIAIENGYL